MQNFEKRALDKSNISMRQSCPSF